LHSLFYLSGEITAKKIVHVGFLFIISDPGHSTIMNPTYKKAPVERVKDNAYKDILCNARCAKGRLDDELRKTKKEAHGKVVRNKVSEASDTPSFATPDNLSRIDEMQEMTEGKQTITKVVQSYTEGTLPFKPIPEFFQRFTEETNNSSTNE